MGVAATKSGKPPSHPVRSGSAGDAETPNYPTGPGGRAVGGPKVGGGDEMEPPKHIRGSSWHPDSDFVSQPTPKLLPKYSGTPLLKAGLRIQPHNVRHARMLHPLLSVKMGREKAASWSYYRFLDVFVHPSTLPEVFEQLLVSKNSTYLAHIQSIVPPYMEEADMKEPAGPLGAEDDGHFIQTGLSTDTAMSSGYATGATETSAESAGKAVFSPLCRSLVVRLCFATKLRFKGDEMVPLIGEEVANAERRRLLGETSDETSPGATGGAEEVWPRRSVERDVAEVRVKEGHIVMSDLLRQQMFCRAGCVVRLSHVKEGWRVDMPSPITLHPLTPSLQQYVSSPLSVLRPHHQITQCLSLCLVGTCSTAVGVGHATTRHKALQSIHLGCV